MNGHGLECEALVPQTEARGVVRRRGRRLRPQREGDRKVEKVEIQENPPQEKVESEDPKFEEILEEKGKIGEVCMEESLQEIERKPVPFWGTLCWELSLHAGHSNSIEICKGP